MNEIFLFLNFTIELAEDFEDGYLPTMDTKLRVSLNSIVTYIFYEKPTAANVMVQRTAALGESLKVSTLVQEVIRRMINTSEREPDEVRNEVLDRCCQKLCNSGHYLPSIRNMMVSGLLEEAGQEKTPKQQQDVQLYKNIFEKTNYNPEGQETVFIILYMIF